MTNDSLYKGLGLTRGRAEEIHDLIIRVVKLESFLGPAVVALREALPDPTELAYACTELGYSVAKAGNFVAMLVGISNDTLPAGFKAPTAQA